MSALDLINVIGIPSIILVLIFIGKKLGLLDTLSKDMNDTVKPDLKDVRERMSALEGKTAGLFGNASPIKLTPAGDSMLQGSGMKDYIDGNIELLSAACSNGRSMSNPYDVQQSVFEFFEEYQFPSDVDDKLKTYAFSVGVSISALRRVGAIYFRDKCLQELGFTPEDVDGHDPNKKPKS